MLCAGGPCDGRRVEVEPVEPPAAGVPPLLVTVDGCRYVHAPRYSGDRGAWRFVPMAG